MRSVALPAEDTSKVTRGRIADFFVQRALEGGAPSEMKQLAVAAGFAGGALVGATTAMFGQPIFVAAGGLLVGLTTAALAAGFVDERLKGDYRDAWDALGNQRIDTPKQAHALVMMFADNIYDIMRAAHQPSPAGQDQGFENMTLRQLERSSAAIIQLIVASAPKPERVQPAMEQRLNHVLGRFAQTIS